MVLRADVRDQATVAAAIAGADAVVNAVSAYVERGGETFETVHVRGAETVARGAAAAGVARLVLVSGIGADPESRSPYIRARGRGERAVQREFPGATIVRPSAMFGPGDALFGTLADLARLLPMLPLIGAGRTRLQPVYVEDVAEAVARMLADPVTASLDLRDYRAKRVHATRAGRDHAAPHRQAAAARPGALRDSRAPGAAVRASAEARR
jgi:Nucleoside-diphosphate-sugar epimerases